MSKHLGLKFYHNWNEKLDKNSSLGGKNEENYKTRPWKALRGTYWQSFKKSFIFSKFLKN